MGTDKHKCPNQKQNIQTRAMLREQLVAQPRNIPKGLVGRKCTANVTVGGKESNCLIDTGSQVTTVA